MEKPSCFINYFQPVIASDRALKFQVYRIRYDVYCAELALEDTRADRIEVDEFDAYSLHYLLQHKATNQYAGTVRMVLPPKDRPELLIPLEKYCLDAVDPRILDIKKLPRGSFAEVSRLAVNKIFRRRKGDFGALKARHHRVMRGRKSENTVVNVTDRRESPNIAVGLYLIAAALFKLKRLDYIFIMIDPKLVGSLKRAGLYFEQMGDVVDYHGLRAPFFITPDNLAKFLKPEYWALQRNILEQVREDLEMNKPQITALQKSRQKCDEVFQVAR